MARCVVVGALREVLVQFLHITLLHTSFTLFPSLHSRLPPTPNTLTHFIQKYRVKVVLPREYNPRFEMDFNSAADYDPDRQRSEAKKLQRQLVKEKRGAMRELRRDASFMAAVSVETV